MTFRVISESTDDRCRCKLVEYQTEDGWMLVSETVRTALGDKSGWRWSLEVSYSGTKVSVSDIRKTQRAAERELERWKQRLVREEWV